MRAWALGLILDKDEPAKIPIWASFPDLDFRYWSKEGLKKLGSLLGKPLATNKATQNKLHTNLLVS